MKFEDITKGDEYKSFELYNLYKQIKKDQAQSCSWSHDFKHNFYLDPCEKEPMFMQVGHVVWQFEYTDKETWMALYRYVEEFWQPFEEKKE